MQNTQECPISYVDRDKHVVTPFERQSYLKSLPLQCVLFAFFLHVTDCGGKFFGYGTVEVPLLLHYLNTLYIELFHFVDLKHLTL